MAKKSNDDALGIMASRRAANDFLRAGRRKERRTGNGFDSYYRIENMPEEELESAIASGNITQEQLNEAGRYAYENYLDDVWSETDLAETQKEPTYEEFLADPEKYGDTSGRMRKYRPRAQYGKQTAPAESTAQPAIPAPRERLIEKK